MSQDAPSRTAGSEIRRGDRCYLARTWAGALALYDSAARSDPAQAAQQSVPLLIDHCRIELAADPAQALPAPHAAMPTGSPREDYTGKFIRLRALELCRAGDVVRASELLRLLAGYDSTMAETYRCGFTPGRSDHEAASPDDPVPPFIRALDVATLPVDALKQTHRGRRVLLVYRRFFPEGGPRQGEVLNCLAISAARFGLDARAFKFEGTDPAVIAPTLLQELIAFAPEIVVYDNQYPNQSTEPAVLGAQLESVLATARQRLGIRIVVSYMDAWQQMQTGAEALYRGLDGPFDLVQHCHPAAYGAGSPEQTARTFCYMLPAWVPAPSLAPGTLPRACFVGSMSWFNDARVAWWAETARRGLPIDFFETLHHEGEPRSDQAYVDLLAQYQVALNFTRRTGGPTIITGRTLDIPLVGGVLLEEASTDTAFFLAPGVHYLPFTTLDDLSALLSELLADPARRERLRTAGQRWVRTYFTGDYFWAGLLRRLAALA